MEARIVRIFCYFAISCLEYTAHSWQFHTLANKRRSKKNGKLHVSWTETKPVALHHFTVVRVC